ncbi:MAG: hypothetical protein M3Q07_15220, partial [Pseudobdellovibrionaceae bacterium]|nr:hypothetical protein [Pseudobdellovibrionaceae bacterium]
MADPFVQYAQRIIKGYITKRGESLKWLAKQTGVAYHKIYRTENGEIKALSYFDAKPLLQFIEPETAVQTLREYFPTESQSQNPQVSFDDLTRQDHLMDYVMEDGARFPVFV